MTFALATCQVGAEGALKAEVQRELRMRPAFMRPGFVTFKADAPITKIPALVFARAFASSLGKANDDDVVARALAIAREHDAARLHVWSRELHAPGEAPAGDEVDAWAAA